MADVLERALDPRVTPRRVLRRHSHDQLTDIDGHTAPSGACRVRPFARNQLAVPPEQRVGRRDRRNVPQGCAADAVRSRGQPAALIIRETEPTAAQLTPEQAVLFDEVRDGFTLPTCSQPVSAPNTICSAPTSITRRSLYHGCPRTVDLVVAHYGYDGTSNRRPTLCDVTAPSNARDPFCQSCLAAICSARHVSRS
jgi:hypothetical protein